MSLVPLVDALKDRAKEIDIDFLDDPNREVERPRGKHLRLVEILPGRASCLAGGPTSLRFVSTGQLYLEIAIPKGFGDREAWTQADALLKTFLGSPATSGPITYEGFEVAEGDDSPAHYTLLATVSFEYEYTVDPAA